MRVALLTLVVALTLAAPRPATGQLGVELSAGALVGEPQALVNTSAGPAVSVALHFRAGLPLVFEVGGARADFVSFDRDFHRNYGFVSLAAEWMPFRGVVDVGGRLGFGASFEDDVNEDDPAFRSSADGYEAITGALVLRRPLAGGRALTLTISDHVIEFVDALFDSGEYSVEHQIRVLLGIRF